MMYVKGCSVLYYYLVQVPTYVRRAKLLVAQIYNSIHIDIRSVAIPIQRIQQHWQ